MIFSIQNINFQNDFDVCSKRAYKFLLIRKLYILKIPKVYQLINYHLGIFPQNKFPGFTTLLAAQQNFTTLFKEIYRKLK